MHMQDLTRALPGGLSFALVFSMADFTREPALNYASLRADVVARVKMLNFRWLLFVDTDVFLPPDAISRLLSHQQPIVSGIYWTKSDPPLPVVVKEFGNGPIWKVEPAEQIVPIDASGLGCCLIDMVVIDAFDRAGVSYFNQNWLHGHDGQQTPVDKGEDYYFFVQARELGFQAYADPNVLCEHYDENTDTFFPGESMLRKIRSKRTVVRGNRKKAQRVGSF